MAHDHPVIFCPFPPRLNPYLDTARAHLDRWVADRVLVGTPRGRERFAHADFGWFAAATYPTAAPADICLVADWFAWLFLVDDQFDDGPLGRDPGHARSVTARMVATLAGPAGHRPDPDGPPAEAALADLWRRTAPRASGAWRERFARHLADCLAAACWEADNRVRGAIPDPGTYVTKRRHTGAIYVCMDLIDLVERTELAAPVYRSRLFQRTLDTACNVVVWTNDVYSLSKEQALGEHHNLVTVLARQHGLAVPDAVARVAATISAETRAFLGLADRLLDAYPARQGELVGQLAGMRSWMRGNLDWSRRTRRYREPAHPGAPDYLEPLVGPTSPRTRPGPAAP